MEHCKPSRVLDGANLFKAESELNETETNKRKSLEDIRKQLNKKSKNGLKTPLDDDFLLLFLRAKKFKTSKSSDLIANYYKVRQEHPDIFSDFSPSSIRQMFIDGAVIPLTRTVPLRPLCILVRVMKWDLKIFTIEDIFKAMLITIEHTVRFDAANQVAGYNFIFDMEGLNMTHVTQFTPKFAHRALGMLENAFPARVKGLHHINVPTIVEGVFQVFKPFLSDKMKRRFAVTSQNHEFMSDKYPPEETPDYLGGLIDIDACHKVWCETILSAQVAQEFQARNMWGFRELNPPSSSSKASKGADRYENVDFW